MASGRSLAPSVERLACSAATADTLEDVLSYLSLLDAIFDSLPDVVFFVKDPEARYVLVNHTLVIRCGFKDKGSLLNRTADAVFPRRFGYLYTEQDLELMRRGLPLADHLELHPYPGRHPGWCLTSKMPLRNNRGHLIGSVGISRDLRAPEGTHPVYEKLANVARAIQENFAQPLNLRQLASDAQMSTSQLERYFHKVFHLTPGQILLKARLDAATSLLVSDQSIASIAAHCGYSDHSAFTRQFKAVVGITPSQYRTALAEGIAERA